MRKRKVNAVLPWFGSKRAIASDVVRQFGPHRAYYELGCGGLSVTLAKPVTAHETIVDMHWHLINLCQVIQNPTACVILYDRLQRTICCESIFKEAQQAIKHTPHLETKDLGNFDLAYHYFISQWMGRNGVSGTERHNYQMAVRWRPGGGHGGVRFRSATENLPWWHQRLRSLTILQRDMWDVLPEIADVPNVVIYVDPPYLHHTRGNSSYIHDFLAAFHPPKSRAGERQHTHAGLAQMLHRFKKARVVVSYYDHPLLAELYPDWEHIKLTRPKNLHLQNKVAAKREEVVEVLIMNGPVL